MVTRWVLRYWAVLVIIVILMVIVGLAEFSRFTAFPAAGPPPATSAPGGFGVIPASPSPSPSPTSTPVGIAFAHANWIVHLIIGIVLVIGVVGLVAAIVLLLISLFRIRLARPHLSAAAEQPRDPEAQRADLLAAVDAGIAELDDGDIDPRTAVIACWVRLERVAADAGIAERPDRTSSDLVAELLENQRVSAATLASFAEMYRTARYSRHTIEAAMRDDARSALRRLRDDLLLDARTTA